MCLLLSCCFDCCLLWHPAYSINSNSQAGRIGGGGRQSCPPAPPGCLGGWLRLVAQPMAVAALPDALLPSLLAYLRTQLPRSLKVHGEVSAVLRGIDAHTGAPGDDFIVTASLLAGLQAASTAADGVDAGSDGASNDAWQLAGGVSRRRGVGGVPGKLKLSFFATDEEAAAELLAGVLSGGLRPSSIMFAGLEHRYLELCKAVAGGWVGLDPAGHWVEPCVMMWQVRTALTPLPPPTGACVLILQALDLSACLALPGAGNAARRCRATGCAARVCDWGAHGGGRRAGERHLGVRQERGDADWVSRPFPSWNRSMLTENYLCHACSCHEISRAGTAGQERAAVHPTPAHLRVVRGGESNFPYVSVFLSS
eukprot:COSAG01_NODE_8311_length_2836_cov_61.813665_2_plen_368_part_00